MVSNRKVISEREAILRAYVQMVVRPILWRKKSNASFDPEITAMFVIQRCETLYNCRKIGHGLYHKVNVDDRFGCDARHRRTADVFDRERQVTYRGPNPVSDLVEYSRPIRVIVNELDRSRTFATLHLSILNGGIVQGRSELECRLAITARTTISGCPHTDGR
jgi:hypothetical protein